MKFDFPTGIALPLLLLLIISCKKNHLDCVPDEAYGNSFFHFPDVEITGPDDGIHGHDGGFVFLARGERLDALKILHIADDLSTNWIRTIDGPKAEVGVQILATSDANYTVVGGLRPMPVGPLEAFILNVDTEGRETWWTILRRESAQRAEAVVEASGGGFIMVGKTPFSSLERDIFITRVDDQGTELWNREIDVMRNDDVRSLVNVGSDQYLMLGLTNNFPNRGNVLLIRVDGNGNELSRTILEDLIANDQMKLLQLPSGGFVVGATEHIPGVGYSIRILRLSEDMEVEWSSRLGGDGADFFRSMIISTAGDLLVIGSTFSYGKRMKAIIIRLAIDGEKKWMKIYGGDSDDAGSIVLEAENGDLIVGGSSRAGESGSNFDLALWKLDQNGDPIE